MSFQFLHSRLRQPRTQVLPAIGLHLSVLLEPQDSDGALAVIETVNAPGFGPPFHRHPETEVFRVLEGRYVFEVDGKRYRADEGDVISVPGGLPHRFVNVSDKPSRQLVMILPALDAYAFFGGLAEVMRDGVPSRSVLNAFGEPWNCEFLGGPLTLEELMQGGEEIG